MIQTKFGFHWSSTFRGEDFLKSLRRKRRPVSKIAAITKHRNFFKWPKLLYFKPESAQI
jgi:hypothetical protein